MHVVVQEISKLWRLGLTDDERKYYNRFASDARDEYDRQMVEYRATGTFTPIQEFMKLPEVNVWVRKPSKRNGLEQEICQYETMIFPKRPPSMDEAYAERERRSLFRRKLRVKGLENSDGTLKDGLDFEELFHEHQAKKSKQVEACVKKEDETSTSDDDDAVPLEGQNNENTLLQNIDEGSLVRIPFAMNLSTDN